MKQLDTRYWIELTAITLLLAGLGGVVFLYVFPGQYPPVLPAMLAIMVALTIAGQVALTRLMDQKFSKFNSAFLIYKALKIIILMIFMCIYSMLHREFALSFLVSTLIMYLVYMIFETRSLNRQSRKKAQQ